MSENIPFTYENKLKNKKKFRFLNKNNYKNVYHNCKQKIYKLLFFISLLGNILSFFYILYIKSKILKEKISSNFIPSNEENINNNNLDNNEFPVLKLSKDELLKMCYKSRELYYMEDRKKQTSHIIDRYHDINNELVQNKINYLSIHESPDYKSKIADKIGVRIYAQKVLGKDISVPILKIYNNTKEINFDELPNQFVLKCNHGAGMNVIVNDKSKLNKKAALGQLNIWHNINFGLREGEFQYINVDKKIFAETFLKDNIEDYKIYCFHGEPKLIRVQKRAGPGKGKINNYYDLNWNLTDFESGTEHDFRDPNVKFERPKNFELMIEYAKKLSAEFVFVRVDFYNYNDTIYLGEMTFTPSNCHFHLKNVEQLKYLGSLIDISKIKKYLFN